MGIESGIRKQINSKGHIGIDELMLESLSAKDESYYKNCQNIGENGDFITSPEISQIFGEIVSLWLIEKWQELGSPKSFILLELGPGLGTFMHDILKNIHLAPGMLEAMNLFLYEINPYFIQKQKTKLLNYKFQHIDNLEFLQEVDLPIICISNEFFDALPIKQYINIKNTWHEMVIREDKTNGQLKFDSAGIKKELNEQFLFEYVNARDGAVIEESVESISIVKQIARSIVKNRGYFLTIDYGYFVRPNQRSPKQFNSTLQAVKNHRFAPLLEDFGQADITAHVDFAALDKAIYNCGITDNNISIRTQQSFLTDYGILMRLSLLQKLNPKISTTLANQVYRLTSPNQMGDLFKAFEFCA